jgi:hypothetical protein
LPISAVDTINLAIEHTKQQLFKPFRLGQWTKLAFVGMLAGELSSGGCNGSNLNSLQHPGGAAHSGFPHFPGIDPAVLGGIIAVIVMSAFVIGIIFMYISSVMRFVLFDSILAKECHIRQGWSRRQGAGWRYFLWKLLYTFAMFSCLGALVGVPVAFAFAMGWIQEPREHLLPLVLGGVIVFFVLMALFAVMWAIFVLTKDFVIPQMALEDIGAIEGWQRLWPMLKAETGAYAAYIGLKIALAIAAGIVVGIATVILGLIVAIPTVGLSVLAVITGKSAGLTWNASTITLAIVVGSILFSVFLYLISLISVPVLVFFPAYSIYFFAGRYRPLSAVLYPAQQVNAIAPPLPVQPPPLPPYPEPTG